MLIRGGNRITVNVTGGLGFADLDYERPDLSPSRLGYVYVSGVPALPDPAQPYFVSVTAGSGVITVVVACTEDVDGFELSWNTEANVPDVGANIMYNSAGQFQVPVAAACYLFARSVRDGRRSAWTGYGEVPPEFADMQTVFDTDIDGYTTPLYADISGLIKVSGEYGIYVYTGDALKYVCTRGTNPNSFNIFSTASGIQFTRFGGRWTVKAVFSKLDTAGDNQNYGVIYRARAEILTGITGETFYELAICRYDYDHIYAYLYSYVGTTRTELAKSGDLAGYLTSATDYYELQFDLNGDVFTITKVATGDVLFTATDTTIAATDERIYTGLHFKCKGRLATPKLTDNILIEKRIASGNPAEVDPGEYYDGLEADTLDTTFNLSENVHWQCGNDDADYCRVAYDDDQLPVLYRYNAAGNLAATTDLMTGNGTANAVAKFTAVQTVADSNITDTGALITLGSAAQVNGAVTVGVDDTGYDVTLYGATAGKKLLWDESADTLQVDASLKIPADAGAGKVLTSDADGVGTWQTMTLTHEMLSATHTDSTADTVVRGDLITGQGATPKWTRLAAGTAGYLLNMGANEPQWSSAATLFGSGTDNYIPKFLVGATPTFADSIMSQDAGATTVTVSGAMQHNGTVTVGVDDTGYDVTLYGATSGKRLLWDESGDMLDNTGWYSHAVTCDQETTASVSATQTASTLQSNTTGASVLDLVGNLWFAFKFTASGDHAVRGIKLYLKSSASLATDYGKYIVAYIYSDNAGLPNARISSGESKLFCPNITTSAGYRDWSVTAALTSGTAYWIVMKFTTLPAAGNVQLYYDATGTANYTTGGSGSTPSWAAASDGYYPRFYLTGRTYYAGSFVSDNNYGANFYSTNNTAFYARSYNSYGVYARSENYIGIAGFSAYQYGVHGSSTYGYGVVGTSENSYGTYGSGSSGGLYGVSTSGYGVYARSTNSYAVLGTSTNSVCGWFQRNTTGVAAGRPVLYAYQTHASDTNNAFNAESRGSGKAIYGYLNTALTNTVQNVMQLGHDTSNTPLANFGAGILMSLKSSTTDTQDAARIAWTWVDATHATRKANLILSVYDTAIRTGLTIAATGSGAALTADGTLTVGADDAGYDVTLYGATAGKKMLWDESADTLQLDGTLDLNGGATLGSADTDAITCTGRLIVRTVNDGDMDATDGTTAEVVFNSADSKFYGCTASGTPATWAALN